MILAWLGSLTVRCLADPCQGVTNGNVENPDDPNCESYIRELNRENYELPLSSMDTYYLQSSKPMLFLGSYSLFHTK